MQTNNTQTLYALHPDHRDGYLFSHNMLVRVDSRLGASGGYVFRYAPVVLLADGTTGPHPHNGFWDCWGEVVSIAECRRAKEQTNPGF